MASNAIKVTVKLNGGLMRDLLEKSSDIIEEVVDASTRYAQRESPYRFGHNRSSLTWDKSGGKSGDVPGYRIYTQSGYGGYLELGTARMAARPYIEPSIRRAIHEAGTRRHD